MLEDATFWAMIGLFLFLALLVYLKVPGMVAAALDRRADTIRTELEEARRLREEAQALLAEYQRKAREAEREAEEIIELAKREAAAFAAEAAQRSEDYVARRTRMAELKISQAESRALQEVRALSADLAITAAERILGDKVRGEVAADLVERSIGQVRQRLS